ncbi:MAG: thiol:disulfide interchange protein DsbA/DsbL [Woeseia sp.]|nr:thiol:disulfide interchange protein DsbA/DsbL [Woeseia sp.]MBT8095783.1 thiol:disulfide interchange protein DsbA/DsbL [Woeseia sp.]NNE61767.1 thiol:disulfide interchange protein DsbA/DsbL [Woeseia sp.]NNL54180.1 thiol:disulfide interchange protein DsbA/DsbL [Woeseia sp.]
MKNPLVFAFFNVFLLSACGADQSATEEPLADTAMQEEVLEEAPIVSAPVADPDVAPTLVEESSAADDTGAAEDAPLMLAKAESAAPVTNWKFKEGQHFHRLVPTQPTVGGADKVEVAEIFWYGCAHCNDFEPFINGWSEKKPADVRFVRIPAMWNPLVKLHGQLFYTEEVLAKNGKLANPEGFHAAVFNEYHQRNNRLTSEDSIGELFARFGVGEEDFKNTWGSFEVAQKMRVAEDLGRRYGITGVPAVVVNGKYRSGGSEAGSYPKLLEVIDELVAREAAR